MIWASPAVLQELIERYESLLAQTADGDTAPWVSSRLRDTAYTLCVSTGTRDVEAALAAARARVGAVTGSTEQAAGAV
ncbi:DUF5133 domain-containing protein [Actinacidiphila sp. ITFR-21]|uniref:DUF5133 domain-containing protein n=1 Tax=Actinacidiphila sp. ITFR-21 TaxID=3075199 RepID=UPI00288C4F53|nr:DUF5133 domain-containing protein [Streptomyces sp. ITFR-21]WNI14341.1 DUF5133 domain-containing protein [Streptomyces sp. ITFR-21]